MLIGALFVQLILGLGILVEALTGTGAPGLSPFSLMILIAPSSAAIWALLRRQRNALAFCLLSGWLLLIFSFVPAGISQLLASLAVYILLLAAALSVAAHMSTKRPRA